MPRVSLRKRVLKELEGACIRRELDFVLRLVSGDDECERDPIAEILDLAVRSCCLNLLDSRYLIRRPYRKGLGVQLFSRDLFDDESGDNLPWLTDEEFIQKYEFTETVFGRWWS